MSYGKVLKGKVQEEDISSYWKFELLKYWKSIASNLRVIWKQFDLLKVRVLKIRVIESLSYWKFDLLKVRVMKVQVMKVRVIEISIC